MKQKRLSGHLFILWLSTLTYFILPGQKSYSHTYIGKELTWDELALQYKCPEWLREALIKIFLLL